MNRCDFCEAELDPRDGAMCDQCAEAWVGLNTRTDPWELTPQQQAELDARWVEAKAQMAAIPDYPPF